MGFKNDVSYEKRHQEASRIRSKYPELIPVICEKTGSSDIPTIDRRKYLVPPDLTMGQFIYVVRKRTKIHSEKSLFMFINNCKLVPTSSLISTVYDDHKDNDGFLYIGYSGENTFG
jgi:GABA(A) receptor-associated protein